MSYKISREIDLTFDEAVEEVRRKLKEEGFGVLTEINVKNTLKEKLNIGYENYLILGVCNPQLAYEALQAEKEIGLLLPCNVIIYSANDKTFVSAINPMEATSMIENSKLKEITKRAGEKLKRVINSLKGGSENEKIQVKH